MSDDQRIGETGTTAGLPPQEGSAGPQNPVPPPADSPPAANSIPPEAIRPAAAAARPRPALWIGSSLSLIWLGLMALYIGTGPGLPALLAEPPLTVAALGTVATLPVLALWLLVILSDRNSSFRAEADYLKQQISLLVIPDEAGDSRFSRLSETLKEQTRALNDATRDAVRQAETVRAMLSRESGELVRITSDIGKEAAPALNRVAEQVKAVSDLIERIGTTTSTADSTLAKRQEALETAVRMADAVTERLSTTFDRHNASLTGLNDELTRRTTALEGLTHRHDAALTNTRSTAEVFERTAQALITGADTAAAEVSQHAVSIRETLDGLTGQTEAFSSLTSSLKETLGDFNDSLHRSADALEERHTRLTDAARTTTQELDAATAAALGDFNAFRDVATDALEGAQVAAAAIHDASQQGEGVRRLLEQQVRALEEAVQQTGEKIHAISLSCTEESQGIAQAADRAAERIRHLSDLMSRSAVDVTRTTARAGVEIETVTEAVKQGAAQINTITTDIHAAGEVIAAEADAVINHIRVATEGMLHSIDALTQTGESFSAEAGHITHATHQTTEAIRALADDLRTEADQFGMVTGHAIERADSLRLTLNAVMTDFEQAVDAGTQRVEQSSQTLHDGMDRFNTSVRATMESLTGAGGALRAQVDGLNLLTEETEDKLSRLNAAMRDGETALAQAGARTTELIVQAGTEFNRHTEALMAGVQAAGEHVKAMESTRVDVNLQHFISETSYVIDQLHMAAIDITRLFSPSVEDDLWKRYYKGEQNAFLSYAAKAINRTQLNAVKKMYMENRDFRHAVNRYLNECEVFMKAAHTNERGDILSAVFASSDMGRLYAVLARAIGRMEAA
ncbi:methyl-accepting chemotaxis protein [Novispirillum itersonii]|uniref:hypothetical protein n=1 Tax=Novispirillum itersonii TaxID=189 RepID=UPI00037898AC|nr:hypothetical protein [Novispirillum itersonii]